MMFNARAWLIWIAAAAILVMVARNPLYAVTLLLVALLMTAAFGRKNDEPDLPLLRIGLLILIFSAIYNGLFIHAGETILIQLPDWPLIGGPITLEALVEGASNGLTLLALLAVFVALNAIVPVSDLVRLTPGALQDLGVVVLIAVTYIPETRRHLARIREAQAIRGHELKGFHDWQPIVMPLLIGGLERAMRLAETMVSRGYGATHDDDSSNGERLVLLLGLLAALAGWLLALWQGWTGWILLLAGLSLLAALLWRRGRKLGRTSYRQSKWRVADISLVLVAILALTVILLPGLNIDRTTLSYSPYPLLGLPAFDWRIGFAMTLLALPAVALWIAPLRVQRDSP